MRASSQASLRAAADRWEPVLRQAGTGAAGYGDQLFMVVDALDSSGGLRRALTEPTRTGEDKAAMALGLLTGKVDDAVVDLVAGAARERWSADRDLGDALEQLGVVAHLAAAEADGRLGAVEDDTFRITRLLPVNRALRAALSDRDASQERRVRLVEEIFTGKIDPTAMALLRRAVASLRERTLTSALTQVIDLAADRRRQVVAVVTSASPLSSAQQERLTQSLSRAYGTQVQVNIAVDPHVVGGFRVQVGDEVVDSTIAARLDTARRRLAG